MYTRTRTYTNKNLPVLYMTYISVLKKLSALNTNKASGPDRKKDLKACKPAQWWKEIKQLSGFSKVERANPIADLQHLADEGEDPKHLAHVINDAFLSPMSAFTPLATSDVHAHAHVHQQEPPRPIYDLYLSPQEIIGA